jgi:hypothetical protein
MGGTALYLAVIKFSWAILREAMATVRETGEVSWEAIEDEVERITNNESRQVK